MAKFAAGEMITGRLTMSDGTKELRVFMVNGIIGDYYSLDDGNGWADSRGLVAKIDAEFERCT